MAWFRGFALILTGNPLTLAFAGKEISTVPTSLSNLDPSYSSASFSESGSLAKSTIARIGIDAHVLSGRFQGTRTTLNRLMVAVGNQDSNHEFVVYCDGPEPVQNMLVKNNFSFKHLPKMNSLFRLFYAFPKLFKDHHVDIGVFQYISPLLGRHIVFVHDILPITHRALFSKVMVLRSRVFFALAIKRAAMVITVSEHTRSEIMRHYKTDEKNISVVLNGPSFPASAYKVQRDPLIEAPFVLTVGRIEARKNIPLLVDAFIKAAVPNARLLIVGSFDNGFHFSPPKGHGVEIISDMSDDELILLYRSANLFVYPSEAEGFGIPLLDATLFGIPTIASNQTSLPEVGGQLATYFDPTSADAVADLAKKISGHFNGAPIRQPTEMERDSQAERFNWDSAARDFLGVVDKVINRA